MAQETWYVMEDGSVGDPREMVSDRKGMLATRDGLRVAYGEHGPRGRTVDPEAERSKMASSKKKQTEKDPPKTASEDTKKTPGKGKEVKPEDSAPGYKTRESRSK